MVGLTPSLMWVNMSHHGTLMPFKGVGLTIPLG